MLFGIVPHLPQLSVLTGAFFSGVHHVAESNIRELKEAVVRRCEAISRKHDATIAPHVLAQKTVIDPQTICGRVLFRLCALGARGHFGYTSGYTSSVPGMMLNPAALVGYHH